MSRLALAAVLMALSWFSVSPSLAQPERVDDTVTGWSYLFAATSTQINGQDGQGQRVFNIERVGTTNTYDMVTVSNSGVYGANGTFVVYNQTLTQLTNYLNANNRRIVDLEVDENAGAERFTAITVPNSGATAAAGWGWLVHVNAQQITDWLAQNPNLRLIDIEKYTIGGNSYYAVVAVPNTGANAQGWGFALNRTADQITTLLAITGSCAVDIELESAGSLVTSPRYSAIYADRPSGAGVWWHPSLTDAQVGEQVNQNGARLVAFHRWTTWNGETRWAVSMMDNSNAETRRVRGILADRQSGGFYGFKVKRAGGNDIASLNDAYAFEPASTLKIAHGAALIRLASLGLADLNEVQPYINPCDSDACPNTNGCSTGPARTLGYILERMLRISDNKATWYIRQLLDDGNGAFSGVNDFIASQGLSSSTGVNHDIGCFDPIGGVPSNSLTANDAVLLYERIGDSSIFNTSWRDILFNDHMNNWPRDRESEGVTFTKLRAILDEELDATNLYPNERADFLDAFRLAYKRGGYGVAAKDFPETFWRSLAGWAQFPHRSTIGGVPVFTLRQYSFVMYQDWATDADAALLVYTDVMELLRIPIRDAAQAWDDSCESPTATAVETSVSVAAGQQAMLSVIAGGSFQNRQFQWQRFVGGAWISVTNVAGAYSGAQTDTLTILNASAQSGGLYRCRITSYCGADASGNIILTVTASCPGDTNGDGVVNFTDLNAVLAAFGQNVAPGTGGDLNGDGVVNFTDLNAVLANFGDACP
jgi:hypothetical protein